MNKLETTGLKTILAAPPGLQPHPCGQQITTGTPADDAPC